MTLSVDLVWGLNFQPPARQSGAQQHELQYWSFSFYFETTFLGGVSPQTETISRVVSNRNSMRKREFYEKIIKI